VLGSLLANHTAVSFLSANHTSDMVEVTSWGPGSEHIAPMINNCDLHGVAVKALDLGAAKPV
jgi:alkaline phosphatase